MLSFFFVANYTLSYFSLFLREKERAANGAPLPRVGLSLDDWNRPRRFGTFFDRLDCTLTGKTPLALGMLLLSYPVFRVMKWVTQRADASAGKQIPVNLAYLNFFALRISACRKRSK